MQARLTHGSRSGSDLGSSMKLSAHGARLTHIALGCVRSAWGEGTNAWTLSDTLFCFLLSRPPRMQWSSLWCEGWVVDVGAPGPFRIPSKVPLGSFPSSAWGELSFLRSQLSWLRVEHVTILIPIPVCGFSSHIKQFSDTSWMTYNSTQLWHYLPGDGVRPHRLGLTRRRLPTTSTSMPVVSQGCYLCLWPATNRRFQWPPPWVWSIC